MLGGVLKLYLKQLFCINKMGSVLALGMIGSGVGGRNRLLWTVGTGVKELLSQAERGRRSGDGAGCLVPSPTVCLRW